MARRLSPQTLAVLAALADRPHAWRYGYELGRDVGLRAGTLYPILMRLSDRGLLEAGWETDPPAGRPPRHLWGGADAPGPLAARRRDRRRRCAALHPAGRPQLRRRRARAGRVPGRA